MYIRLKLQHVSVLKGHYRVATIVNRIVYAYKVQNYICRAEVRDGQHTTANIRWPTLDGQHKVANIQIYVGQAADV
jgi:hypothetical protein